MISKSGARIQVWPVSRLRGNAERGVSNGGTMRKFVRSRQKRRDMACSLRQWSLPSRYG